VVPWRVPNRPELEEESIGGGFYNGREIGFNTGKERNPKFLFA